MWVVDANLVEAIALGQAWGFEYRTVAFVWVKTVARPAQMGFWPPDPVYRLGLGYWARKQTELCLLFTRGKPRRLDKGVRQIIEAPRRQHSRKPDLQYERIERLVGGPYLELFARRTHPGWSAWGNEVGKFDQVAA